MSECDKVTFLSRGIFKRLVSKVAVSLTQQSVFGFDLRVCIYQRLLFFLNFASNALDDVPKIVLVFRILVVVFV